MEYLDTASSPENAIAFTDEEIEIVKRALKSKLYRRDEPLEARLAKFQAMLTALSDSFQIPEVRLELSDGDWIGWEYLPEANKVVVARFSLVSVLDGFAQALLFHKNQGLPPDATPRLAFPVLAFGLSAFKQAAPIMFDAAKMSGRLVATSVPFTDGGRLRPELVDEDGNQMPDVDPENRRRGDRGNGAGED